MKKYLIVLFIVTVFLPSCSKKIENLALDNNESNNITYSTSQTKNEEGKDLYCGVLESEETYKDGKVGEIYNITLSNDGESIAYYYSEYDEKDKKYKYVLVKDGTILEKTDNNDIHLEYSPDGKSFSYQVKKDGKFIIVKDGITLGVYDSMYYNNSPFSYRVDGKSFDIKGTINGKVKKSWFLDADYKGEISFDKDTDSFFIHMDKKVLEFKNILGKWEINNSIYDNIGKIVISGNNYIFSAIRDGEYFIIKNDVETKRQGDYFTYYKTGNNLAYEAVKYGKYFNLEGFSDRKIVIIKDDIEINKYNDHRNPIFSPDGKSFSYIGVKKGLSYVVKDDKEIDSCLSVGHLLYSENGDSFTYSCSDLVDGLEKWFVIKDSTKYGPYDTNWQNIKTFFSNRKEQGGIRYSPSGKIIVFQAKKGDKNIFVINGDEFIISNKDIFDGIIFSPDGSGYMFADGKTLIKNGKVISEKDGEKIGNLLYSQDGSSYIYSKQYGGTKVFVRDSENFLELKHDEYSPDNKLYFLKYSPDGKNIDYFIEKLVNGERRLIIQKNGSEIFNGKVPNNKSIGTIGGKNVGALYTEENRIVIIGCGKTYKGFQSYVHRSKIFSPIDTLSGSTFSGTTKVEVIFSGTTKKDRYFLTKFKTGDSEFSANLRLDYGNIEKGKNYYEVISYQGEEAVASDKYEVNVDYEEIKVGGSVIYSGESGSYPLECNEIEPILIKEKGIFRIIKDACFSYSKEDDYYLEIRNIKGDSLGDLYFNGDLIAKNFEFSTSSVTFLGFSYDKKGNFITKDYLYAPGDCATFGYYYLYDLKNKNHSGFNYDLESCGINSHISVYPGYEKDNIKKIIFYVDSSIFSVKYGDYSKNFIYSQKLNFLSGDWKNGLKKLRNEEDLIYNKGKYEIKTLLTKPFEIDFSALEKEKTKMNDIIYGNYEEIIKKEVFEISFLKNQKTSDFTLHFNKIKYEDYQKPKKFIKSIGITSCKPNNSPEYDQEYILKTQTDEGSFTYNISEKLGNKCDIPYKIQVYYEDGTKEMGEYYILFDY